MSYNKLLIAGFIGLSFGLNATASYADTVTTYECEGNIVELFKSESRVQIYYKSQSIPAIYNGKGAYVNTFEQIGFKLLPDSSSLTIGKNIYGCSDSFRKTQTAGERSFDNQSGMSLGGTLRSGPGIEYSKVGSLAYGAKFNIKANSGVEMGGYDWFVVRSGKVASYQWGGIMCSDTIKLDGILYRCPQIAVTNNSGPYVAFAIADDGTYGHATSNSQKTAVKTALTNCGQSTCKVEIISTSQCHAYAHASDNSLWFGQGNDKADADDLAMGYCMNGGRGCRLEASFCQN